MQPHFVALRRDGIGCRLTALLNAMVLAEKFDGTFAFAWPANDNLQEHHAYVPAEEIFSRSFIKRFRQEGWADRFDPMEGNGPRNRAYAAHRLTKEEIPHLVSGTAAPRVCWLPELEDYGEVAGFGSAGALYAAAFDQIEFVPAIAEAISLARAVDLTECACALHLRGGDIVFNMRFSNQFTRRVVPFPLIAEIGRRANAAGREVLVFGQETATVDHVAEAAQGRPVYELVQGNNLTRIQGWFFETCLMARCDRIYAGTSAFAGMAARIAGTNVQDAYDDFRGDDAFAIACDPSVEQAALHDLHKAFAFWSVQEVYRAGLSPIQRLECLRRALIHDPVNSFYRLARVTLLSDMGDVAAARRELQAIVDAETVSIDWREGCLRHILVNLRGKTRATATRYTGGIEALADRGAPEALLCMALLSGDRSLAQHYADRFRSAEGDTRRARFYSLALAKVVGR